jgi:signal peptidase I
MEDARDLRKAIVLSVGVALLTLIPYVISNSMVDPDSMFSGFLLNPVDGFSYLAKMQQGSSGDWLFHLPYAAEPGEGALLFIYYIHLGR